MFRRYRLSDRPVLPSSSSDTTTSPTTAVPPRLPSPSPSQVNDGSSAESSASSKSGRNNVLFPPGKKRLHSRWVFLTYLQCSLTSKTAFASGISSMLDRNGLNGATFYGGREQHYGNSVHYYVLIYLAKQPNWSVTHACRCFEVDGNECQFLSIWCPSKQQIDQFVERSVRDCERGRDCFGQRPQLPRRGRRPRQRIQHTPNDATFADADRPGFVPA